MILVLTSTAGCATPYQATGFQGALTASQLADDAFEIRFEGNIGVDATVLEQSLQRRAAEVALQHGYRYFVITGRNRQAGIGFTLTPNVLGSSRHTVRSMTIRCSPPPGEPGAIDAQAWLDSQPATPRTL